MTAKNSNDSWIAHIQHFLLLYLKLKSWRFIFAVIPVAPILLNVVYGIISVHGSQAKIDTDEITFYRTSDLVSSGHSVIVDRSVFPTETEALTQIMKERGGSSEWLKSCKTDRCDLDFISEKDSSVIAYIKYSKKPSQNRAVVECRMVPNESSLRCALLYQLMLQSMATSKENVFKDVQYFTVFTALQNADAKFHNSIKPMSLPKSLCSAWLKNGINSFVDHLSNITLLQIVFSTLGVTLYMLLSTLSSIRALKSSGFFHHLVRNGLSVSAYWTVVLTITCVECLVFSSIFLLSFALPCPGAFSASSMAIIFIYMYFYFMSFAAISLLLDVLLSSRTGVLMLLLTFFGFTVSLVALHGCTKKHAPFMTYLFPTMTVFDFVFSHLSSHTFKTALTLDYIGKDHPYHQNCLISICAFVLLIIPLTIYLDFLTPTGNGLRLPPYYLFSTNFWNPSSIKPRDDKKIETYDQFRPHMEQVIELRPLIIIDAIHVSYRIGLCGFSSGPKVLDGLSCSIYADQITALIGHNGSGKSTLIKALTGEQLPSDGEAFINGFMATDSLERLALRGSITNCPQFDALSESLSVIDNICIMLASKGLLIDKEMENARAMLQRLGLADKENVKAYKLSCDQKRKVNTILALLGDPDVVLLDEPTSSLDPISRRQLWQLLQEKKIGRSIVICTQYMDEADILADRKIFLCGGQIVCAGSSMFLKQSFGCNFTLNVSLKSASEASKLISGLKQVQVKSQYGTELKLEVPATQQNVLIDAVRVLETSPGVQAFGLSQANLEDIFMKLSGLNPADVIEALHLGKAASLMAQRAESAHDTKINSAVQVASTVEQTQRIRAGVLQQFSALMEVNVKRQVRDRSRLFDVVILPAILITIVGIVVIILSRENLKRKAPSEDAAASGFKYDYSSIRVLDSFRHFPNLLCIYDFQEGNAGTPSKQHDYFCHKLALSLTPAVETLYKPSSEGIESFLMSNSTAKFLTHFCSMNTDACIIYHFSSWNESDSNQERNITIGVFAERQWGSNEVVHALNKAFNLASLLFTASDFRNFTALSHLKSVSSCDLYDPELIWVLLMFSVFAVSYMRDPMEFVSSKVRGYLMSMGMTHLAYWINTFVLHWIQYAICIASSALLLFISERFRNFYFVVLCIPTIILGATVNQLFIYAIVVITRAKIPTVLLATQFLLIFTPCTIVFFTRWRSATVPILILLLPPVSPVAVLYFGMGFAFYNMEYFHLDNVSGVPHLYERAICLRNVIYSLCTMCVHIVIFLSIISLVESARNIWSLNFHEKVSDSLDGFSMDQGARKEAERVLQSPRNSANVLEVRQLSKIFKNAVTAVRGISFATFTNEVFGLLGANGAGKTTFMSVIVGEETPTSGLSEVRSKDGIWVSGRSKASISAIGYCPQHNPLFRVITVAEHLKLYSRIRGVPSNAVEHQITALMDGLGLKRFENTPAAQLSSGNKRRLCLAIALLGDPSLIVIDDASTGVDPENKRFIWSAIRAMLNGQRSVLVTTHSMEEVEAICHRVGIMNMGRMIALGTVQQLQTLYRDAYTLDIMLPEEATLPRMKLKSDIQKAIAGHFKGAVLTEPVSRCLQFYVPKASVPRLSNALMWLATNQSQLGMSYFSFHQMSLDELYIKIVKQFDGLSRSKTVKQFAPD